MKAFKEGFNATEKGATSGEEGEEEDEESEVDVGGEESAVDSCSLPEKGASFSERMKRSFEKVKTSLDFRKALRSEIEKKTIPFKRGRKAVENARQKRKPREKRG